MPKPKVLRTGLALCLGAALGGDALAQVPQPIITNRPTLPSDEQGAVSFAQPSVALSSAPSTPMLQTQRTVGILPMGATQEVGTAAPVPPIAGTVITSSTTLPVIYAPCTDRERVWFVGEYLLWWTKEQSLPPLVTTGDDVSVGRLGFEGTQVLFGGRQSEDPRAGIRLGVGTWFGVEDPCNGMQRCVGGELNFFWLSDPSQGFQAASDGSVILARPIINALTGQAGIEQVANPALDVPGFGILDPLTGGVTISQSSQLLGAELNGLYRCAQTPDSTLDLVGGLRFLSLRESLRIQEDLFDPINQEGITVLDSFDTQNRFYGAQIGVRSQRQLGAFVLEVTGKVALGSTREEVQIEGFTTSRFGSDVVSVGRGGLLALDQTNIGKFDRDVLTVVPEITVNANYQFNQNLRVFLGYNFLYWSNVTRPGNNIDIVVNPNFVPSLDPTTPPSRSGQSRPTVLFGGGDFWAMGLNLGLELRY